MNGRLAATFLLAGLLGGCASAPPPAAQPSVARLYLETRPDESGAAVVLPRSGLTIKVGGKPVFLETDFIDAAEVRVDLGLCLVLRMSPAAARDLYRLSAAARGRRLILCVDDQFVGARRIDQLLADGELMMFVELPDERLPELVRRLNRTSTEIALAARRPGGKLNDATR